MKRRSRHRTFFYREIRTICRWSFRYSYLWILATLVLSVPAFLEVRNLRLDTDLTRLLPQASPAVRWSNELEPVVGDGGYFSLIFEGEDRQQLITAVDTAAAAISAITDVSSVDHHFPVDFISYHRYMLIPVYYLDQMVDLIDEWEIDVNPMVMDLENEVGAAEEAEGDVEIERILRQYGELTDYHEDPEGRIMGMIVRTRQGISNLAGLQQIYARMDEIASEIADELGVWYGIGGSLRNRVSEFDIIIADLRRSGLVSAIAILLTLAVSFRALSVLPIVLFPLGVGLLWSFALVPTLVGNLNTITSFLLMVLFGMGVDYSIHLVKRFQAELLERDAEEALLETFSSTGRSVATSGATTALGLSILAISDFRGFSDFGIIGGSSMLVVLVAMMTVQPAALTFGYRTGMLRARAPGIQHARAFIAPRWATALTAVIVLCGLVATRWLQFDYDFTSLSATVAEADEVKEKERQILPGFFGPAGIYVARDLDTLDGALKVLEEARAAPSSIIGPIRSVRDFAPDPARFQRRMEMITDIKERLSARWVDRIEDPDVVRLIADLKDFVVPPRAASIDELPASLLDPLTARDDSGALVLAVNATGPTRDGRRSMAFTEELYGLQMSEGLRGPTGDKPVIAEILSLVTEEAPNIVMWTLFGVFFLVALDRRSPLQAAQVLLPLIAGLLLTFGIMVTLDWKLNFFNIVVLPAILGIGVDHGDYYRRWRELNRDTALTQAELFEPLTSCTITTVMGYAGMTLAHHPGLRSIGDLAVLGLGCCWITALWLLPGFLRWRERSGQVTSSHIAVAATQNQPDEQVSSSS